MDTPTVPLPQPEKVPHIQVSELFGPTLQGEGREIGQACLFIRLHHCPVKCPGCDTHYTWDGSEAGEQKTLEEITTWVAQELTRYPKCGVVLSGGEPLIHYRNADFRETLGKIANKAHWLSLETSGYAGVIAANDHAARDHFAKFIKLFDSVHLSPKVTPCLHGQQSDEKLLSNVSHFIRERRPHNLAFKFVVKNVVDVDVVRRVDEQFGITQYGIPIYLMPYGQERDEILETSEALIPFLAQTGYKLSPRLHSIMWGKRRMV